MKKNKIKDKDELIAYSVSFKSIIVNVALSILKFIAGIIGKSTAMIGDALHSASDIISTIIVIIGIKISKKDSDSNHPYGHEKFECIAAIILAFMLFMTGLLLGINGIRIITTKKYVDMSMPGIFALVMAVVSIITKEAMFWYTRYYSKKINSPALMADAWHHRSDSLSSIGSFVGILASILGFKMGDSIASIVIALFIVKASFDIFVDAINKVVDKSCDDEMVQKITKTILTNKEVIRIDNLKTRLSGNKVYVDVEIAVDKNLSLEDAHDIAEDIHNRVETKYKVVKHCMVHVNPIENEN